MHKPMKEIILITTALTTGLIGGLFYAYTCSVNIGLGLLHDREYLTAMQSINSAILNPLFFMSFMGTLLLLPISAWLCYKEPLSLRFTLLLAASILYMIGVFGVTVFGNVPLNDALAQFNVQKASAMEITQQRMSFEKPWLMLHNIRTVCSVICLILVLVSLLDKPNPLKG